MLRFFAPIGLSLAGVYGLAFQIANWVNASESVSRSQGFALCMVCSCLVNSLLWLPRGWAGLRNFSLLFLLQGAGIAGLWGVAFVLAVMAMGGPGVTAQQAEANLRLLNGASLLTHLAASHLSCYFVTVVGKRNRSSTTPSTTLPERGSTPGS